MGTKLQKEINLDPILREFISDDKSESYDILQRIEHYFLSLSFQERSVMILVLYGYNQSEISAKVGYSQQHVSRIIRSARKKAEVILASDKGQKYMRKKRVVIR